MKKQQTIYNIKDTLKNINNIYKCPVSIRCSRVKWCEGGWATVRFPVARVFQSQVEGAAYCILSLILLSPSQSDSRGHPRTEPVCWSCSCYSQCIHLFPTYLHKSPKCFRVTVLFIQTPPDVTELQWQVLTRLPEAGSNVDLQAQRTTAFSGLKLLETAPLQAGGRTALRKISGVVLWDSASLLLSAVYRVFFYNKCY